MLCDGQHRSSTGGIRRQQKKNRRRHFLLSEEVVWAGEGALLDKDMQVWVITLPKGSTLKTAATSICGVYMDGRGWDYVKWVATVDLSSFISFFFFSVNGKKN